MPATWSGPRRMIPLGFAVVILAAAVASSIVGCQPLDNLLLPPDEMVPIEQQLEPATSDELICQAEQNNELTHAQAVLYRVFAAFGDGRLPDQFAGPAPDRDAAGEALREAALAGESLPQDVREQLAPFLRRPNDASSIFAQRLDALAAAGAKARGDGRQQVVAHVWSSRLVAGGKVRLWITSAINNDQAVLDSLVPVFERIHTRLVDLMGDPLPDVPGPANSPDALTNPDDAIDIYLLPQSVLNPRNTAEALAGSLGVTIPAEPFQFGSTGKKLRSSAFVLVDGEKDADRLAGTAAHEFFHTQQFAHAHAFYGSSWLTESTATWAEHFALDVDGIDPEFIHLPPLTRRWGAGRGSMLRAPYGSYLYFLVAAEMSSARSVAVIWDRLAQFDEPPRLDDQLDAVNTVLPFGNFLPVLAQGLWNEPTGKRNLLSFDAELPTGTMPPFTLVPVSAGQTTRLAISSFERMAAVYLWLQPAGDVGTLRIRLTDMPDGSLEGLRVVLMMVRSTGTETIQTVSGRAAGDGFDVGVLPDVTEMQMVLVNAATRPGPVGGQLTISGSAELSNDRCEFTHPKRLSCQYFEDGSWRCSLVEVGPQCNVFLATCDQDGCTARNGFLDDLGGPLACPDVVSALAAFRAMIAGLPLPPPGEPVTWTTPLPSRLECGTGTLCRSIILCPKWGAEPRRAGQNESPARRGGKADLRR